MATNKSTMNAAFETGAQGMKPAGGKPKMIDPRPGGGKIMSKSGGGMMKGK